jgi:hypothetical protein
MRSALWLVSFAAFAAAPAQAGEWNLFTPCRAVELSAQQERDYARWRYCEPNALSELHRAFDAPPLSDVAGPGRAVRVSAVDGEGNRIVAIDAVQRGGRTFAIVRGESERRRRRTMRKALPGNAWNYIAAGAARLEDTRAVAPIYDACQRGLDVFVEIHGFGEARTLRGKVCDGGATFVYGRTVADLVFAASPNCRGAGDRELSLHRLKACVED